VNLAFLDIFEDTEPLQSKTNGEYPEFLWKITTPRETFDELLEIPVDELTYHQQKRLFKLDKQQRGRAHNEKRRLKPRKVAKE
jgi:hypothetical protein